MSLPNAIGEQVRTLISRHGANLLSGGFFSTEYPLPGMHTSAAKLSFVFYGPVVSMR